ncbi:glycosyltransferase family 4 protein [Candidatus Uhrbacteria bacterium]|nr:glycosyltransferase family 4 protein [Candidatus Uhrbacteria bacterium]
MFNINLLQNSRTTIFAIDASSANKEKRTGVENYAFHLIEAMKKEPLKDGERVVLFSPTPLKDELAKMPKGWESKVLSWKLKRGWMQTRVSWELLIRRPNVFFVPAQSIPSFSFFVPVVTTIHDIAFRRIRNLYSPSVRRRVSTATKRAVKKATRILSVSQFTKQELQSVYNIDGSKIFVTLLSANTNIFKRLDQKTIESVLQKFRLGHNFFLFVGRLEKKKNVATIIRAFEVFKQNRGMGDPFELVLVGEPGFGYEEIKTYIERSSQKTLIREIGFVSDEEVSALMNSATAFLFPSWYEGFGIPNLEAIACGTALLTSDIPVHHEVAGDSSIFISPKDPELWAKQMTRLVADPQIKEKLIEKGSIRAQEFSWEKTAKQTLEVLRSLI